MFIRPWWAKRNRKELTAGMFDIDLETMRIEMHKGDTGSFLVTAEKTSGDAWTDDDRMIFTVAAADGTVVLERYYRLDSGRTSVTLPAGQALIEFHNDDTDGWSTGSYNTQLRFVGDAVWDGDPVTTDMADSLAIESHLIEGVPVRTALQSTLQIRAIYGGV